MNKNQYVIPRLDRGIQFGSKMDSRFSATKTARLVRTDFAAIFGERGNDKINYNTVFKIKSKKIIPLLFLFFMVIAKSVTAFAITADDAVKFDKANKNYQEGHFKEAAVLYEELSRKYPGASVFFYNLGNSFFRSGARGAAILAYEGARLTDPRDSDDLYNLNYVQGLLEYRIEDKRNWYLKAAESTLKYFTSDEINFFAAFVCFLFLANWSFTIFFRRGAPWGWFRKTLLILSAVSVSFVGLKNCQSHFMSDAVVMSKEAEVRYGPSDSDQVAFRLGEGLKIYVVDRRKDWSRVLLWNGESGWVKKSQIAEIRL